MTSTIFLPRQLAARSPMPTPAPSQQPITNCDGQNIFFCPNPSGNCYTGTDGFVGCCSQTGGCVARSTCLDYSENPITSCNIDYGGCFTCTNPGLPWCVTISNYEADQRVFYCSDTALSISVSYALLVTTGNSALAASPTSSAPSSSSTSTSSSPSSTSTAASGSPTKPSTVSAGEIAGIAIGAALLVALILLLAWFLIRRHQKKHPRPPSHLSSHTSFNPDSSASASTQPFLDPKNSPSRPHTPSHTPPTTYHHYNGSAFAPSGPPQRHLAHFTRPDSAGLGLGAMAEAEGSRGYGHGYGDGNPHSPDSVGGRYACGERDSRLEVTNGISPPLGTGSTVFSGVSELAAPEVQGAGEGVEYRRERYGGGGGLVELE